MCERLLNQDIINGEFQFSLQAFHNDEFITINNDTFKNKWSVLFFYPADFTFVCPTELKDLADNYDAFKALGVEIYSISTDTHFVHKAWHDESESIKAIKFPMIADPAAALSWYLNVYDSETGLADRATFLIDPQGKIALYEVSAGGVGRDANELLRKIEAYQFTQKHSEVCPAKWRKGSATIKPTIDNVGKI